MEKKKKPITNRAFLLTAVIGSLLIMAMVTANSVYSSNQTLLETETAVSDVSRFYLDTMADRRAKAVSNLIDNEFTQMEKALDFIREEEIESQDELRETLGKIKKLLSLNRFALVDQDDIVYTQYTTYTGRSRYEFLSEEKMSDRDISTVSLYGSSKQLCLAIPTPHFTIMGKPFKACFIQNDIKDIVDLLAVVLLLELRALSKNKLAAETENRKAFQNMATRDSLTGARNTHAYAEYERDLNQKIQDGEIRELAVVVCDINGLKHTNDTLGHAAGDQLIKDACALICEYFVHGTVFRIGGDEFAILLQNKGYDTVKETMRAINRKIEENITENGVVVSIGYSVLETEDQQVRDVFERADKMMYDRKKALKAMGAKTRES